MRAFRLVDSLFALHSAGQSLPPISGGGGTGDERSGQVSVRALGEKLALNG